MDSRWLSTVQNNNNNNTIKLKKQTNFSTAKYPGINTAKYPGIKRDK